MLSSELNLLPVSRHDSSMLNLIRVSVSTRTSFLFRIGGLCSIILSIIMSGFYMVLLGQVTSNDYFWIGFNSSGVHSYLCYMYNEQLWLSSTTPLPLFSIQMASEAQFSNEIYSVSVKDTIPRRKLIEYLDNVPHAIDSLRRQTIPMSVRSHISYCWLDFFQHWQVAHTAKRQLRCQLQYKNNGAVYLEAMLRNIDWDSWYKMWGHQFEVSFGTEVRRTQVGRSWLNQTTSALGRTTILDEIEYWNAMNITRYRLPWHNSRFGAYYDSITIKTAMQSFSLPLHQVLYSSRGTLWTTAAASYGVWNDLAYAMDMNASLIRNASNSFTLLPYTMSPEMWCGGYPDTSWSILLHTEIGPLASIDLVVISPTAKFLQLYELLRTNLLSALEMQSSFYEQYTTTSSCTFDMIPKGWNQKEMEFYGGNLLCIQATGHRYVQQSFGFDDACAEPHPLLSMDATKFNIILAFQILHTTSFQSLDRICAFNQLYQIDCKNKLNSIWNLYTSRPFIQPSEIDLIIQELIALKIQLVQYAQHNTAPLLLEQNLLDINDPEWSFYGWLHLFDWIQGTREVVAFQGDENTKLIISKQYTSQSFIIDPLQTPTRFSLALWILMWYMNGILLFVLILSILCYLTHGDSIDGRHLFVINRVVGLVWIGRPLLFLRGFTAMAILSTAQLELKTFNGFTYFKNMQRTWLQAIVLSGETLWCTYSMNDILSIGTRHRTFYSSLGSSILAWICTFFIGILWPYHATAIYDRYCTSTNMDFHLSCNSGTISIGSDERFLVLVLIQFASVFVVSILTSHYSTPSSSFHSITTILPSIATHMFFHDDLGQDSILDSFSCSMSGFITWKWHGKKNIFSTILWVPLSMSKIKLFKIRNRNENNIELNSEYNFYGRSLTFRSFLGFLFLISSAFSSVTFLAVSSKKLGNDFLWEEFNSTGIQAFLMDWYNRELMNENKESIELFIENSDILGFYNKTTASVGASTFYSSLIHFNTFSFEEIIHGIRRTSPCRVLFLSTQFCYVDFQREWEMAHSLKRQERCKQMQWNGAVYLESIFRNTNLPQLELCWGDALKFGIYNELGQTSHGQLWIESMKYPMLTIVKEAIKWKELNFTKFQLNWQNYKRIGLIETFNIENAFGVSYPLTLKTSQGQFIYHIQNSIKMYWGFSNDLNSILLNNSFISHFSFIRSSSFYAFKNYTIENIIIQNSNLFLPLDPGLSLVRNYFGPFGNIDLIHLSCPIKLIQLLNQFIFYERIMFQNNKNAQYSIPSFSLQLFPLPQAWKEYTRTYGGNILCPTIPGSQEIRLGLLVWYGILASCSGILVEPFLLSRQRTLFAMIAWGIFEPCHDINCLTIQETCERVARPVSSCISMMNKIMTWFVQYMPSETMAKIHSESLELKEILYQLEIEIVQYGAINTTSPIELIHTNLFDPNETLFQFFSWHLVSDWAQGYREVISIEGDHGKMTTISNYLEYTTTTPNSFEIPGNLVYYCMLCIQYTTSVMLGVTFGTILYTFVSWNRVEGYNMFKINRVGGIAWVGRPLLFLRSLVAICLLATATAKLEIDGMYTSIKQQNSTIDQIIMTILGGLEVTWLGIVISDLGITFTKDHTRRYSVHSTLLVSLLTALLSYFQPVKPTFILERICTIEEIDFQLRCHAGKATIGSVTRLWQLVALTSFIMIFSYLIEIYRHRHFKLPQHQPSVLLPASALYLFNKKPWIVDNILHMDTASAFTCGLLSLPRGNCMYVLDVITWRVRILPRHGDSHVIPFIE